MNTKERESFVRWQGITRDHFTFTTNLVLGLSVGLLGFLVSAMHENSSDWGAMLLMDSSICFLAISIVLALLCSINRLRDFRLTAQIARKRNETDSEIVDEMRLESKILGARSWCLFWWQLMTFGLSAVLVVVAIAVQQLEHWCGLTSI